MYQPKIITIDEIIIEEIIFDTSYDVTLFCSGDIEEPGFFTLGLSFEDLNYILMQAGKKGNLIAEKIGERLKVLDEDEPVVIDIEEIIKEPLLLDTCNLHIYKAHEEDEEGNWIENEEDIYFLEDIERKTPAELETTHNRRKFEEHLDLLYTAFQYFLKLRDSGIDEKKAREKAGLSDELLFNLAYYYDKMGP